MLRGCKFVLLYLMCLTVKQYVAGSTAGYKYIQEEDTWLRLHIVPATWAEARLRCHLEGGVLASPTTRGLTKAMQSMMAAQKLTSNTYIVFIGISAFISKGDFMSLDGVPLANISVPWAVGEPNNLKNDEDCLIMTGIGELSDISCEAVYPYFCRKEDSKISVNRCGTTDNEYEFEARTGSCYKFHHLARTWHRAAMACHAVGAHLAVINSPLESQVLKELYAKKSALSNSALAFIGVWDWKEHGEFLTVFGERLAAAGFDEWSSQPTFLPNNQLDGKDFCGAMNHDGRLNYIPCDVRALFICEITPK